MFGAFTFGNAEYGTIPTTDQNANQEEIIIFSPGTIESGDDGSVYSY